MASIEEWNVPNSDDERDEALVSTTTKNNDDIPMQILDYFEEIEQRNLLELKVQEFRKVIPDLSDNTNSNSCQKSYTDNDRSKGAIVVGDKEKYEEERSIEPSEFDEFDEPEKCQGNIPKRTPKPGRLPKKRVGTLKNVISNLKRFRELDNVFEDNDTKHKGKSEQIDAPKSNGP